MRRVPLGRKLINIIREFIKNKDDSEYVCSSRKGKGKGKYKQHIRRDSLGKELKKAVVACGITDIVGGTHTPRKTYGYIQYLEHDKDINYVQELFGHSSSKVNLINKQLIFVKWVLGKNCEEKIMTGSYNETLSTMFSKNVRNAIQEQKDDIHKSVYFDIFLDTDIKRGDNAMNLWNLEGGIIII